MIPSLLLKYFCYFPATLMNKIIYKGVKGHSFEPGEPLEELIFMAYYQESQAYG